MRVEYTVYDISNKVLKLGLSFYEWGAVIFIGLISVTIFHRGLEFFYDMAFTAALVAVLKFYKLGKPDGFVGSLIRFYMSSNIYHVHYRQENKSVNIRFKL
ncbi:MAG: hypothetical protein ACYCSB_06955 [bacterium]